MGMICMWSNLLARFTLGSLYRSLHNPFFLDFDHPDFFLDEEAEKENPEIEL